jgi:hypothetical protein
MSVAPASDAGERREDARSAPFSVMRLGARERLLGAAAATAALWLAVWWAVG